MRQNLESSTSDALRKLRAAQDELQKEQDRATNEKSELERRLRTTTTQRDNIQEDLDAAQEEWGNQERLLTRKVTELEDNYNALDQTYSKLKTDFDGKISALRSANQQLTKSASQVTELEGEVLRLKNLSGDVSELAMLRHDLLAKVQRIARLENTSEDQLAELATLRQQQTKYAALEEEKRQLEQQLLDQTAEHEAFSESRLRLQVLEDEKRAWMSYIESQASDNEMLHFDSPEDLAKAFMEVRVEKANLAEKLGDAKSSLASKDENIARLESSLAQAREVSKEPKIQTSGGNDTFDGKARARLERQRNLAVKEADYLRAHLKEIIEGDQEQRPEAYQAESDKWVQHLEETAGNYRREIEKLNAELSRIEVPQPLFTPRAGGKRGREDGADERLGELLRRNRQLQDDLAKLQGRISILTKENAALSSQLSNLKFQSRTRILELRDNPTTKYAAVKQSTLQALQAENNTLREQLAGRLPTASADQASATGQTQLVPRASLDAMQLQLTEKDETIASRDKSLERLRSIFRAKGLEFREAVFSLLGWKLDFQPNGRVRASSMYYPKPDAEGRKEKQAEEGVDAESQYILFDGENGTMKVSGGPQSEFAREIRGLIDYWVDGKGQVPCMLAAMTLEFYEKYGVEAGGDDKN